MVDKLHVQKGPTTAELEFEIGLYSKQTEVFS